MKGVNMPQGVILAGGYSSRMEQNKMLLEIDAKTIIEHAIEAMQDHVKEVIIVTGRYHEDIQNVVSKYPKVRIVRNDDYDQGMFSSVLRGVREVDGDCFLTPGDYPLIKSKTYEALLKKKGAFRVPVHLEKRGHPVYMEKAIIEELKKEPVTSNLKSFRNRHELTEVDVKDPGILFDVDFLEEYEAIKNRRD